MTIIITEVQDVHLHDADTVAFGVGVNRDGPICDHHFNEYTGAILVITCTLRKKLSRITLIPHANN